MDRRQPKASATAAGLLRSKTAAALQPPAPAVNKAQAAREKRSPRDIVPPKHSNKSRSLAGPDSSAISGSGDLGISVEFTVSKRRQRRRQRVRSRNKQETPEGPLKTRRRKLVVRTQATIPTGGGSADGWTPVPRANSAFDVASSTLSFQCSEATSAVKKVKNQRAAVDELGEYLLGTKARSKRLSQQKPPAHNRDISQGLRELQLISQRLRNAVEVSAATGLIDKQQTRTRDYLMTLHNITETALAVIGRFCLNTEHPRTNAPSRRHPPLPSPPTAAFESCTFGSQQVQASETDAATTFGPAFEARIPAPQVVAHGNQVAIVRWRVGPAWITTGQLSDSNWWTPSERCACVALEAEPEAELLPSCQACHLHPPARCRAVRHSGQHPSISRALACGATAARFASAEPWLRRIAVAKSRCQELPRFIVQPLESAKLRLAPDIRAVATRQPLFAPLLGVCALRRAPPTTLDRCASHPVMLLCGRHCATICPRRLATAHAASVWFALVVETTASAKVEAAPPAGQLQDNWSDGHLTLQTEWTERTRTASSSFVSSFAPMLCLRMSVLPMPPEPGTRRIRPLIVTDGVALSQVESRAWPPQTRSASSAVPICPTLPPEEADAIASCLMSSSATISALSIASGDKPDSMALMLVPGASAVKGRSCTPTEKVQQQPQQLQQKAGDLSSTVDSNAKKMHRPSLV